MASIGSGNALLSGRGKLAAMPEFSETTVPGHSAEIDVGLIVILDGDELSIRGRRLCRPLPGGATRQTPIECGFGQLRGQDVLLGKESAAGERSHLHQSQSVFSIGDHPIEKGHISFSSLNSRFSPN